MAFSESGLIEIQYEENSKLTTIGDYAFSNIGGKTYNYTSDGGTNNHDLEMKSLIIPDSVTTIGRDHLKVYVVIIVVVVVIQMGWFQIGWDL